MATVDTGVTSLVNHSKASPSDALPHHLLADYLEENDLHHSPETLGNIRTWADEGKRIQYHAHKDTGKVMATVINHLSGYDGPGGSATTATQPARVSIGRTGNVATTRPRYQSLHSPDGGGSPMVNASDHRTAAEADAHAKAHADGGHTRLSKHENRVISDAAAYLGHEVHPPILARPDPSESRATAAAYESGKHNPHDPDTKAAYAALAHEVTAQYKHLLSRGAKFTPWTKPGQPYATSLDMAKDVHQNRHLYYFPSESGFGGEEDQSGHPLLAHMPGTTTPINDAFRAVHDWFGHAMHGHQFGPIGEYRAFHEHSRMFSPEARKALAVETHGQNSWVNFGPHRHLPVSERPYAEQKTMLLPEAAVPARLAKVDTGVASLVNHTKASPEDALPHHLLADYLEENNLHHSPETLGDIRTWANEGKRIIYHAHKDTGKVMATDASQSRKDAGQPYVNGGPHPDFPEENTHSGPGGTFVVGPAGDGRWRVHGGLGERNSYPRTYNLTKNGGDGYHGTPIRTTQEEATEHAKRFAAGGHTRLAKMQAPAGGAIVNNQQVRGGGFLPQAFKRISTIVAGLKLRNPESPAKLSRHWTPEEADVAKRLQAAGKKTLDDRVSKSMENKKGNLPTFDELKALAVAGESTRGEYERSFQHLSEHIGPRRTRLWVALNAVMSPQTPWKVHTHQATQTLADYVAAREPQDDEGIARVVGKAKRHVVYGNKTTAVARVLKAHSRGEDPLEPKTITVGGVGKVNNFAQAFYHPGGVPIDVHMMKLVDHPDFPKEPKALSEARAALASKPHLHLAYKKVIGHVADDLGWEPRHVQESTWATIRSILAAKHVHPDAPHEALHHESIRTAWDMGQTLNSPEIQHELKRLGVHDAFPRHDTGLTGPVPTEGLASVTKRLTADADASNVVIRNSMHDILHPGAF